MNPREIFRRKPQLEDIIRDTNTPIKKTKTVNVDGLHELRSFEYGAMREQIMSHMGVVNPNEDLIKALEKRFNLIPLQQSKPEEVKSEEEPLSPMPKTSTYEEAEQIIEGADLSLEIEAKDNIDDVETIKQNTVPLMNTWSELTKDGTDSTSPFYHYINPPKIPGQRANYKDGLVILAPPPIFDTDNIGLYRTRVMKYYNEQQIEFSSNSKFNQIKPMFNLINNYLDYTGLSLRELCNRSNVTTSDNIRAGVQKIEFIEPDGAKLVFDKRRVGDIIKFIFGGKQYVRAPKDTARSFGYTNSYKESKDEPEPEI